MSSSLPPIPGNPTKVKPSVTADGTRLQETIHGMKFRPAPPQEDDRGELIEVFNAEWRFDAAPFVYLYQVSLRAGAVRGWVIHREQEDRIFISRGHLRWAFFDARDGSPTHGSLAVHTFSDSHRVLFNIPPGVYHGVQNVGEAEALFLNLPDRPYRHADPDKYRLPLKNDLIPFDFSPGPM